MKVQNMRGKNGNRIPNQFIIEGENETVFQSYDSVIAKIANETDEIKVYLDQKYWNYSRTTSKYLYRFLGKTRKQIEDKIKAGDYILTDLN